MAQEAPGDALTSSEALRILGRDPSQVSGLHYRRVNFPALGVSVREVQAEDCATGDCAAACVDDTDLRL